RLAPDDPGPDDATARIVPEDGQRGDCQGTWPVALAIDSGGSPGPDEFGVHRGALRKGSAAPDAGDEKYAQPRFQCRSCDWDAFASRRLATGLNDGAALELIRRNDENALAADFSYAAGVTRHECILGG